MMPSKLSTLIVHLVPIGHTTWPPVAIVVPDWLIFKNLLLCNYKAQCFETLQQWSLVGPLQRFHFLFQLGGKHGGYGGT